MQASFLIQWKIVLIYSYNVSYRQFAPCMLKSKNKNAGICDKRIMKHK